MEVVCFEEGIGFWRFFSSAEKVWSFVVVLAIFGSPGQVPNMPIGLEVLAPSMLKLDCRRPYSRGQQADIERLH